MASPDVLYYRSMANAGNRIHKYLLYTQLTSEQVRANFLAWMFSNVWNSGQLRTFLSPAEAWYLAVSVRSPNLLIDPATGRMIIRYRGPATLSTIYHTLTALDYSTTAVLQASKLTPQVFINMIHDGRVKVLGYDKKAGKIDSDVISEQQVEEILNLYISQQYYDVPQDVHSVKLYQQAVELNGELEALRNDFYSVHKKLSQMTWEELQTEFTSRILYFVRTVDRELYRKM